MTKKASFKDYIGFIILFSAVVWLSSEGRRKIEAEQESVRTKQAVKQEQNARKLQTEAVAEKAKQVGLMGPRIVHLPYQEPLFEMMKSIKRTHGINHKTGVLGKYIRENSYFISRD